MLILYLYFWMKKDFGSCLFYPKTHASSQKITARSSPCTVCQQGGSNFKLNILHLSQLYLS